MGEKSEQLWVGKERYRKLRTLVKKLDKSMNDVIDEAIDAWIADHSRKKK